MNSLGGPGSAFVTIAFSNYVDRARVLFESLRITHPDSRLFFLAMDRPGFAAQQLGSLANVLTLEEVGFTKRDTFKRRTIYTPLEFATSVKARLLLDRLRDFQRVTYLDPDIQVFQELRVSEDLLHREVLLTPHMVRPVPNDGRNLTSADLGIFGNHNLGFISATKGSETALGWWDSMLEHEGDFRQGHSFTDQKIADHLVNICDLGVVRYAGWNVAYWNIHEREIAADELVFFHFSGFNPDAPGILTKFFAQNGRHRYFAREWLTPVLRDYAGKCIQARGSEKALSLGKVTFFEDFPVLRDLIRRSYIDESGYRPPPSGRKALGQWLFETGTGIAGSPLVPPIAMAFFLMRSDLQYTFAGVSHGDPDHGSRLLPWLANDPEAKKFLSDVLDEIGQPHTGFPSPSQVYPTFHGFRQPHPTFGVNHIAYFGEKMGIGSASELLFDLISGADVPQHKISLPNVLRNNGSLKFSPSTGQGLLKHSHTILGVNGDQVLDLFALSNSFSTQGKRIGYWWWESEVLPPAQVQAARKFNEIWVGSNFVRELLRQQITQPVKLVQLPLGKKAASKIRSGRKVRGSGPTRFFHNSSLASDPKRKNPLGVAVAYMKTFSAQDAATLRLHLTGSGEAPWAFAALEEIVSLTQHRADIEITTNRMSGDDLAHEIESADCFVSLHRSEGLGLNIRDAIAFGTPVIATAYGGNMDFMNPDSSFLVGYKMGEVGKSPYYPAESEWAEPDLNQASSFMSVVADSPELSLDKATSAKAYLESKLAPEKLIDQFLRALFDESNYERGVSDE